GEIELQRDHRGAAGARRQHLLQARRLAELALERRRDRRGHHLGARARIEGEYLDGRVIDLRQRRDRQLAIRDHANEQQRDHQQRSRNRPQDEKARRVHPPSFERWRPPPALPGAAPAGGLISGRAEATSTCAPGRKRSTPSVTIVSPGRRPSAIAWRWPSRGPSFTGRKATVLSDCTTYTNIPCAPRCTAAAGTITASRSVSSFMRTLTNWFGKRPRSSFANCAFSFTVPVCGSTWLSAEARLPAASFAFCSRSQASTGIWSPDCTRFITAGRRSCGTVKTTATGSSCVMTTRPLVSPARTMLPGSTRRSPRRPLIGALMRE